MSPVFYGVSYRKYFFSRKNPLRRRTYKVPRKYTFSDTSWSCLVLNWGILLWRQAIARFSVKNVGVIKKRKKFVKNVMILLFWTYTKHVRYLKILIHYQIHVKIYAFFRKTPTSIFLSFWVAMTHAQSPIYRLKYLKNNTNFYSSKCRSLPKKFALF